MSFLNTKKFISDVLTSDHPLKFPYVVFYCPPLHLEKLKLSKGTKNLLTFLLKTQVMRGLSQQRSSESRTKRRVQSLHFGWVKKKRREKQSHKVMLARCQDFQQSREIVESQMEKLGEKSA